MCIRDSLQSLLYNLSKVSLGNFYFQPKELYRLHLRTLTAIFFLTKIDHLPNVYDEAVLTRQHNFFSLFETTTHILILVSYVYNLSNILLLINAVSYTHLDVYKRQVDNSFDNALF